MTVQKPPRVLTVAGSDSGGGAGIQADIKTITVLGGYATSAITALTAQNSTGVQGIFPVPAEFVARQMTSVLDDIGTDAIKTGMLANADIIRAVAEVLKAIPEIPLIVDPVMVATSGDSLLEPDAVDALKVDLIPKAIILTPNIPEAEALSGLKITTVDDMTRAAKALLGLGCDAVLIKGGHLEGAEISDLLCDNNGVEIFSHERIKTRHSHGTGCTLASAIAYYLASGMTLKKAVGLGREYVLKAMRSAPGFGAGNGPLGHTLK